MILSVSRRTDIPAFFSQWFINRIQEGYVYSRNPMNPRQVSRISIAPDLVDCIVFWTKNPLPMIDKLSALNQYMYYFQVSITGLGNDFELYIPDKKTVILPAFQKLGEILGPDRMIWRYDPILVNDKYTVSYHIDAFQYIAQQLRGYTTKCVISFVDFYAKTKRNLGGCTIHELSDEEKMALVANLVEIASANGMRVESCAEKIDLSSVGVEHGSCIDRRVIEKITGGTLNLTKSKSQREACGCIESIDIGLYDTCSNGCRYCYATFSQDRIKQNLSMYEVNSPILCSQITSEDKITERRIKSNLDHQLRF